MECDILWDKTFPSFFLSMIFTLSNVDIHPEIYNLNVCRGSERLRTKDYIVIQGRASLNVWWAQRQGHCQRQNRTEHKGHTPSSRMKWKFLTRRELTRAAARRVVGRQGLCRPRHGDGSVEQNCEYWIKNLNLNCNHRNEFSQVCSMIKINKVRTEEIKGGMDHQNSVMDYSTGAQITLLRGKRFSPPSTAVTKRSIPTCSVANYVIRPCIVNASLCTPWRGGQCFAVLRTRKSDVILT